MYYGNAFNSPARRLGPLSVEGLEKLLDPRCIWWEDFERCGRQCVEGIPVCHAHGLRIAARMVAVVREKYERESGDEPVPDEIDLFADPREAFVYYLMLSPTTVKIGTTRDLPTRIKTHGSELQYVVALERGSYDLERARHDQFPMERHGVKEVFTISDDLRRHIEDLASSRDELMAVATRRHVPI